MFGLFQHSGEHLRFLGSAAPLRKGVLSRGFNNGLGGALENSALRKLTPRCVSSPAVALLFSGRPC